MANVQDVANFFVYVVNHDDEDTITNMKLQKLLYYAQGCYMSRTGKPLFDAQIEAWTFGPVVPEIYRKYKVCGADPIRSVDDGFSPKVFSQSEMDALIDVMREYGRYTGATLVSMTHRSGTPWRNAVENGFTVIPTQEIMDFFSRNSIKHFVANGGSKVDVLPAAWYDPSEDAEWEEYLRD